MSTIVGIECTNGALLAVDRLLVQHGRVESTSRDRLVVVDDAVGAVCVGPAGGVDEFIRQFRRYGRTARTAVRWVSTRWRRVSRRLRPTRVSKRSSPDTTKTASHRFD